MKNPLALFVSICMGCSLVAQAETVKLKATADVGVSSYHKKDDDERIKSWGKSKKFKLKSIQEMGLVRFDATPIKGREVTSAKLFLHRMGKDRLRYIRISTVNNDWEEGTQAKDYGPPSGGCFQYADWDTKREWAWPGSDLSDVIMSTGNSLHHYAACEKLPKGWISIELTPDLVYALVANDSDGLAIQDGGNLAYYNNFIHSVDSGAATAPYLEVSVGKALNTTPSKPEVKAVPATDLAFLNSGTLKLSIAPAKHTFCWRVKINGKAVPRWQIAHPSKEGATTFYIRDLKPGQNCTLEVVGVSRSGSVSDPVQVNGKASDALKLEPALGKLESPKKEAPALGAEAKLKVWACPGLAKIDPLNGQPMYGSIPAKGKANGVWDGTRVALFGMRGEYVSYQLVLEKVGEGALNGIKVTPEPLKGPGGFEIKDADLELFKNWYAQNGEKKWQPAYCVPLKHAHPFDLPDPLRKMEKQQNQSLYVDVYIPKDAQPGTYAGQVSIRIDGSTEILVPVKLEVVDLLMPDKLEFWPQLNCYRLPKGVNHLEVYRLAHQNRNVFFLRNFRPQLSGKGASIKVDWAKYDKAVGPLVSGDAFKGNRRAGEPIEAIGLPFIDSWPTDLTPDTYRYKGNWTRYAERDRKKQKVLIEKILMPHYMTAPRIETAFSDDYIAAFKSVQRQFIEHFKEKAWNKSEMQCLFMGKITHRIQYRVNMWWTTDEPYHWADWLALQYYGKLWCESRGAENAKQWIYRADISRPQWQGTILDGCCDVIHFGTGAFSSPAMYRRAQRICRNGPSDLRVYGGVNKDTRSNNQSVVWVLNSWLNGGRSALPWQAMGNEKSLDTNDASVGGNAMIAPGTRFGTGPVADIRLKAFRDGEQLIEYLLMFQNRYKLTREQLKAIVMQTIAVAASVQKGAGADNADALQFNTLQGWQMDSLRRKLAGLILAK